MPGGTFLRMVGIMPAFQKVEDVGISKESGNLDQQIFIKGI
jgi:hypothetical protein